MIDSDCKNRDSTCEWVGCSKDDQLCFEGKEKSMSKELKLKPCPFCGQTPTKNNDGSYSIYHDEDCYIYGMADGQDVCIVNISRFDEKLWNERITEQDQSEVIEGLQKQISDMHTRIKKLEKINDDALYLIGYASVLKPNSSRRYIQGLIEKCKELCKKIIDERASGSMKADH